MARSLQVALDAQGQVSFEDVPLAVNKTTKEVNKNFEIYLSLYPRP